MPFEVCVKCKTSTEGRDERYGPTVIRKFKCPKCGYEWTKMQQ